MKKKLTSVCLLYCGSCDDIVLRSAGTLAHTKCIPQNIFTLTRFVLYLLLNTPRIINLCTKKVRIDRSFIDLYFYTTDWDCCCDVP